MFADRLKYLQGYVRVRLIGYAPERFLNLCSKRDILIWNVDYQEEHYEFCVSVGGFRKLKPLMKKTQTRLVILQRYGMPFLMHRYRKRKLFFGGIIFCSLALYILSLFIWNIEVQGNLHETDSSIIKFLEENEVYHGILKKKINCSELEELLRSEYEDVIWASVKLQGTRLIIDIQENLATNQQSAAASWDGSPTDLVAEKDCEIYSILTRAGTPFVEKGNSVAAGDILVEGKIPIYNDSGEIVNYQYCQSDADILAISWRSYEDRFTLNYTDQVLTGREKSSYSVLVFGKLWELPFGKSGFSHSVTITKEYPLKLGENFYLPVTFYERVEREYRNEEKTYTPQEAEALAQNNLDEFCEKLRKNGVQIIENNVIIVTERNVCLASGEIKVIEAIGQQQATQITELLQEGPEEDGADGDNH